MGRSFDEVMLGSIELFCITADAGTFTEAAQRAGVTPAAVSRAMSRLEKRLGVDLFARSTRHMALTDAGAAYLSQCKQALSLLVEAEHYITGQQAQVVGKIRISLPTTFGHYRVLPLLAEFRKLHPRVDIEVNLSNRNVDFVAEGYDLAIRGRAQPDSSLIAKKFEDAKLVVIAAPDYLRRVSKPRTLDDLTQHDCIQFRLPSSGQTIPWLFSVIGKTTEVMTSGGWCCSEDLLAGITLARHGAGLFQTYRFLVEQDLVNGTLVEVLAEYSGCSRPFSLLYAKQRSMPLRTRTLVDFLYARLK